MPPNLWQFCLIIAVLASVTGFSWGLPAPTSIIMRITMSSSLGGAVAKAGFHAIIVHHPVSWTLAILPTLAIFGLLGYLCGAHVHRRIKAPQR
ncbi:MAG TPA: hypothetical protein VLF59_00225 [Candidatus Saccharimonadales bacterium]|nr:hypothetical protein [Candidatus Saccharimonadales bacterium]